MKMSYVICVAISPFLTVMKVICFEYTHLCLPSDIFALQKHNPNAAFMK